MMKAARTGLLHPCAAIASCSLQELFRLPGVEFEAKHTGFDLKEHDAQLPLLAADPQTLALAQRFLASHHTQNAQVSERVNELIHRLLPTGPCCQISTVADQLAMHPRTLQRRLRLRANKLESMLDAARKDSPFYLMLTSMQLNQISARSAA